jgi:hypothetical protein
VKSDLGPDDVRDEPPFGPLQFTFLEVLNALLDLDSNKGPGPDDVPPLILKNGSDNGQQDVFYWAY